MPLMSSMYHVSCTAHVLHQYLNSLDSIYVIKEMRSVFSALLLVNVYFCVRYIQYIQNIIRVRRRGISYTGMLRIW